MAEQRLDPGQCGSFLSIIKERPRLSTDGRLSGQAWGQIPTFCSCLDPVTPLPRVKAFLGSVLQTLAL